jgi:hypothetical protein
MLQKKLHLLIILFLSGGLTSCLGVRESVLGYNLQKNHINQFEGAWIEGTLLPQGGNASFSASVMVVGFAAARLEGPYQFLLYAVGEEGQHEKMQICSIRYQTATGRTSIQPHLENQPWIPFSPTKRKGIVQATWHSPGELKMNFDKENWIEVEVNIVIQKNKIQSAPKKFILKFQKEKFSKTLIVNAGLEIYRSIKHRKVPFEDSETGANLTDWTPPPAPTQSPSSSSTIQ